MRDADAPTILIVEDERIVAADLQQSLLELGYDVLEPAASYEEAVTRIADRRPDLALMDIRIRGDVDGIETAALLAERFHVPVVYLTAHADASTLDRAKATDPLGYLVKPVQQPELKSTVEIALHRRQLDQRQRERELRLMTTLRAVEDAVIVTDEAGRITFLNPAAEALTGWREPEAVGLPVREVVVISEPGGDLLIARDGRQTPIEQVAAPLGDRPGDDDGGVLVLRDASNHRRERSLAWVASSVSHQLRPARAADPCYIPRQDSGDRLDAGGAAEHRIHTAAVRVAKIIDDFLGLSRITRGALQCRDVDLSRQARQIIEALRAQQPERDVDVIIADDIHADVDPELFRLALDNLLRNAWKFTLRRPRAHIEFGSRDGPTGPLLFVRDDGVGFAMENARKLFHPFHRLHPAREFEGRGIGLATAHRVISRHGGRIWAESAVDRGATFFIELGATSTAN